MVGFIRDKADRLDILRQIIKYQAEYHVVFDLNTRNKLAPGWTVLGEKFSTEFVGLWVNFWDQEDFTAMIVCGGGAELHMGLAGSIVPSAGFARVDGTIWLLRTGRVHRNQTPVSPLNDIINIDGRSFYKIARINDPGFFEKVFGFHLSQDFSAEGDDPGEFSSSKSLGGRGVSPHSRNAADVDPRHPIVFDALKASLGLHERNSTWKNLRKKDVPTDLYISHGTQRFIFEIKPYTNITTIGQTIGQLLLYKHLLSDKNARMFAVVPNEGCSDVLRDGLAVQGIEMLGFDWVRGQPIFSQETILGLGRQ